MAQRGHPGSERRRSGAANPAVLLLPLGWLSYRLGTSPKKVSTPFPQHPPPSRPRVPGVSDNGEPPGRGRGVSGFRKPSEAVGGCVCVWGDILQAIQKVLCRTRAPAHSPTAGRADQHQHRRASLLFPKLTGGLHWGLASGSGEGASIGIPSRMVVI